MSENKHLDHLILVGVTPYDTSTSEGRRAQRHVMDAANVAADKIFFYPKDVSVKDIMNNSFMKDPAKKKTRGFDIGDTVCIASQSVGKTKSHQIGLLKELTIDVRLGVEDVALEEMSESNISEWMSTGTYTRTESHGDEDQSADREDGDSLDLLTLLGTSSRGEDSSGSTRVEMEEDLDEKEVESGDDDGLTSYRDLDEDDEEDDVSDTSSRDRLTSSIDMSQYEDVDGDANDEDDLFSFDMDENIDTYDSDPVDIDEDTPEDLSSITEEDLFRLDDLDDEDDDEGAEELAMVGINSSGDDEFYDDDDEEDDEPIYDDSQSMIREYERDKKKAALLKKKKKKKEEDDNPEMHRPTLGVDKTKSKKNALLKAKSERMENTTNEDGTRKNFRDYMTKDENRHQDVAERSRHEFGPVKAGMSDSRFVGKDTGRIILVTSGKGGVGKSLVASGIATALSLARNKYKNDHPQAIVDDVWLIESDYNSPMLHITYDIDPTKNLGNIASVISQSSHGVDNDDIRRAIEENIHVDEKTGVKILACPPLSERRSSKNIPYAIILAIKYASERGGDVIVDHGNLTDGVYSELDEQLSIKIAHRVVLVANMNCITETSDVIAVLTEGRGRERRPSRNPNSIGVILNSARSDQRERAQYRLRPIEIIGLIQPIDHLKPENSFDGIANLKTVPRDVQKAIIDRCGHMLEYLGYSEIARYFNGRRSVPTYQRKSKGFIGTLSDILSRR